MQEGYARMKNKIIFIIILMLLFSLLTGCYSLSESLFDWNDYDYSIEDPNHPLQEETNVNYTLVSLAFENEGTPNPGMFEFYLPHLIRIDTYEIFKTLYPNSDAYDETFFETHGLIKYKAFETDVLTSHEIVGLYLQDSILTLKVNKKIPEVVIALYVQREITYIVSFEKPLHYSNIQLEINEIVQHKDYYLDQADDLEALEDKIASGDYVLATIRIVFDFNQWENNGKSVYIEQKIQTHQLNTYTSAVSFSTRTITLTYNRLNLNEVNRIKALFDDPDVIFIIVGIRNFDW